jgi:tetratricopeptide (TPR) repeat protein
MDKGVNNIRVSTVTSLAAAAMLCVLGHAASAGAQSETRKQFEAGQYQAAIDAAGPDAEPPAVYLAALGHEKAGAVPEAVAMARRLTVLPEDNPWHFVGQSFVQLLENQPDAAAESARRATAMPGAPAEAQYQLGLVLSKQQLWQPAAEAFDHVTHTDPTNAYAYYYAGLMHYRAKRTDLMAGRFERFLKLAPNAPERPEVQQIMRTVRGR